MAGSQGYGTGLRGDGLTDREKLLRAIDLVCDLRDIDYQEHGNDGRLVPNGSIDLPGVKLMFTDDGEIKSICRDGKIYGPDGARRRR